MEGRVNLVKFKRSLPTLVELALGLVADGFVILSGLELGIRSQESERENGLSYRGILNSDY